jgi:conjugative relaxase-like TrwC/TraI family protein
VARTGADYYLSDLGRELPAVRGIVWTGAAASALGLRGDVDAAALRLLLEGRHPLNGRPMGSGRTLVAGWDLTLSAPKSVSVLYALAGPNTAAAVVASHDVAVSAALLYLERHAVSAVRRRDAEADILATSGVVGARVTHGVNRNQDPHLHTHVVAANLVHGSDGIWSACDRRGLEAHRVAADACYQAHLRSELVTTLGVQWSRGADRGSEIAGVPLTLLGEFASRAAEIRLHRHQMGARSARGARVAWAVTRAPKVAGHDYGELATAWSARARALGIDRLDMPRRTGPPARRFDEHRFSATVWTTPHGGVRRRDAVAAFADAAPDGVPGSDLGRVVDQWVPAGRIGVGEPLHPRRAVVPDGYLVRALGARPLKPDAHEALGWCRAGARVLPPALGTGCLDRASRAARRAVLGDT